MVQIFMGINPWHLLWSSVLFSVLFTAIIVESMSIILIGSMTQDYLITGVVAAFFVSILVVFILVQFIDYLRKMDESLQNNINFMETLLNTIRNPIFYKDRKGIYLGCNKVFSEQIMGLPKERIIGCSLYDLPEAIPRDLADIYLRADMAFIRNPGTQIYEAPVQCSDGLKRDFLFNKATYSDAGGHTQGMVGVMVDITDQKLTEEALREERDKIKEALAKVKTLSGLLPICSNCKKIRDDKGYWNQIETFISRHSETEFSHGICPHCAEELYPEYFEEDEMEEPENTQ